MNPYVVFDYMHSLLAVSKDGCTRRVKGHVEKVIPVSELPVSPRR
jgi:hypothetical protein